MKKTILYACIFLVGIAGLVVLLVKTAPSGQSPRVSAPAPVTDSDHIIGPATAPVTLIEYGDFQCPACGAYHPVLQQLVAAYGDRLRFVFRPFPLKNIHQNAIPAARAAEAAGKQGKFWEMHNVLFEKQSEWADQTHAEDTFAGYAKTLGLHTDQFVKDMNSSETASTVQEDYDAATAMNLAGTPSFFVNGAYIQSPQSFNAFKAVIDSYLSRK